MVYIVIIFRTLFFYILLNLIYRVLGKREIGELSIMDLTLSIFLTELAALAIDKYKVSIFMFLIPIAILVIIEILESKIFLNSDKVRRVFEGVPSIIINKGKINFKEMIKQRYNISDLLTELRSHGIKNIEEVSYAILETNGKLSVFTKEGNNFGSFPLPLILNGRIDEETLKEINKKEKWVYQTLKKEKITLEEVFYAFYHHDKLYIIREEDLK